MLPDRLSVMSRWQYDKIVSRDIVQCVELHTDDFRNMCKIFGNMAPIVGIIFGPISMSNEQMLKIK